MMTVKAREAAIAGAAAMARVGAIARGTAMARVVAGSPTASVPDDELTPTGLTRFQGRRYGDPAL